MQQHSKWIAWFGTSESPAQSLSLTAGPLSVCIEGGTVRRLCWHGIEVVRLIACPIRDHNWVTCPATGGAGLTKASASEFQFECQSRIADHIVCDQVFSGSSTGLFRASVRLTIERDVLTNRAGFTVLHPLDGLTGSTLRVTHADASVELTRFPELISPQQVAFDIAGLSYDCHGVQTDMAFSGEIFEMEDQRNWGDASYKTYCRPLSLPVPYLLPAGTTVEQSVEIRMSGGRTPGTCERGAARVELRLGAEVGRLPTAAIALEAPPGLNEDEIRLTQGCKPRLLQARLHPQSLESGLQEARVLAAGGDTPQVELEIVLPERSSPDTWLAEVASRCEQCGLRVAGVIALPEAYLKSYQPTGPWPAGPTPRDACMAARRAFPGARIGGGVLTHFAEFNRCRPAVDCCDYISHGFTALVHAADDLSVIECLEGLSHVYASARALANGHPYSLGLVSIGMRSNPYGSDVAGNPRQVRMPMAQADPRQRGLFAAAWAVGAMAATERYGITSVALAAPVGAFGIIYRRTPWPQPIYDELGVTAVYPLFHVFRALSQLAGARRLSVELAERALKAVAVERGEEQVLLVSNLSTDTHILRLPCQGTIRMLDEQTFMTAIQDPDWLLTAHPTVDTDMELGPYAVAFVRLRRASA